VSEVFWIKSKPPVPLAIVLCPRGNRSLQSEIVAIERAGIQTLVSMLENWEAAMLGLADEGRLAEQAGMRFLSHPIPDTHIPQDVPAFRSFAAGLARRLQTGERIGVHCRGSIGRATVASACTLIHLGWPANSALAAIEEARGCQVPDTEEQQHWILHYKAEP
jgi:protein-tyrosine phosphatase